MSDWRVKRRWVGWEYLQLAGVAVGGFAAVLVTAVGTITLYMFAALFVGWVWWWPLLRLVVAALGAAWRGV